MHGIGETEFLGVGRVAPEADWHMSPHFHSFCELIVVMRGRTRVRMTDREYLAGPGDVLLYPPKVAHEEWAMSPVSMETLFISFRWEPVPDGIPLMARDSGGRIRELIGWLHAERDTHGIPLPALRTAFLNALLAEYIRNTRVPGNRTVEAVRRYMREHLASPMSLADLAREAGLSRFHFLRRYRDATGRTPMQDLRHMRLEAARTRILSSSAPLKTIAPQVGFTDEYQLSRAFRKYLNMTPRELRNRA